MAETTVPSWADATFVPWFHRAGARLQQRHHGRAHDATWDKPLRWNSVAAQFRASHGRRRRILCGSDLVDVFHPDAAPMWRADLFALIEATPELDWILPTRYIEDVRAMAYDACSINACRTGIHTPWSQDQWPDNVWLGVTITSQADALREIPLLLAVPAKVRFLRLALLSGAVDFYACGAAWAQRGRSPWFRKPILHGIDWVVAGGETEDLIEGVRSQCSAARVPLFFDGQLLDGRTWEEFPGGALSGSYAQATTAKGGL